LWWYALSLTDIHLTVINVFIYIILALCGLLITYSLWLMLVTMSFWYYRIDNITELFNQILDLGKYPMVIFKGLLKLIVFTVIPLGVITNFPVQALLSKLTVLNLSYALLLTAVFLAVSRWFWLFAVKRYSSASS
jgi:ABC-2 type transport system permease protein